MRRGVMSDAVVVNSPILTNWNHKVCTSKIKTVNQISEELDYCDFN